MMKRSVSESAGGLEVPKMQTFTGIYTNVYCFVIITVYPIAILNLFTQVSCVIKKKLKKQGLL